MDKDDTILFNKEDISSSFIKDTLKESCLALEERGYNSINQIVGYLISGDLGYISSYKDTRNRIAKLDRSQIIETILKEYLK